MFEVVSQAALIIACGLLWRALNPVGLDPAVARRVLTGLVYYLLLPALVLMVMWRAPLSLDALRVAALALVGLLAGLGCAWAWYKLRRTPPTQTGALLLAATFPNVTYLGLPVLEKTLGPWARGVAIQYDLFACTPFLLTAGIMLARRHGTLDDGVNPWTALLKVPPLWAAALGVVLNEAHVPLPEFVAGFLSMLAAGVVPLMLISLGLGLYWPRQWREHTGLIIPAVVIQLITTPLLVNVVAAAIDTTPELRMAIVLEAAMPSMLLGVVLCDRYGLDTQLYAETVTATTLLALISLPLWHAVL
jgi:predicted permease